MTILYRIKAAYLMLVAQGPEASLARLVAERGLTTLCDDCYADGRTGAWD
jgi:hypothetical protein